MLTFEERMSDSESFLLQKNRCSLRKRQPTSKTCIGCSKTHKNKTMTSSKKVKKMKLRSSWKLRQLRKENKLLKEIMTIINSNDDEKVTITNFKIEKEEENINNEIKIEKEEEEKGDNQNCNE